MRPPVVERTTAPVRKRPRTCASRCTVHEEPNLAAACRDAPETCPAGLQCVLELGCIATSCPKAGPGAESGCPENGFCYTVDSSSQDYCARLCERDADCTAVNPALICWERSSTEAFGKKLCILP
ncbi:hypothetical protein [Corallococcus sp. AB011P]|uniref:hypothetical protein n=1 Tax=Corallococcus sp. AB011P TaxID=2316735 RepID=UPI0011C49DE0|nr:hypothetical protein [Corallococcus sp. AB011P]